MQEIRTLDLKRTGIVPLNKLETFMLIEGTKHYYISSEGRLANDIKGKFYVHSETLAKATNRVHWKIFYEDESGVEYKRDVYSYQKRGIFFQRHKLFCTTLPRDNAFFQLFNDSFRYHFIY